MDYPKDYFYYKKYNFPKLFKNYTGEKGYLVLFPYIGGFNNTRMSLELALCLCYLTNRVLVLPPTYKMPHFEENLNISDFFDLKNLGIKWLSFIEFCDLKGFDYDFNLIKSKGKNFNHNIIENVIVQGSILPPLNFIRQRKLLKLHQIFDNTEIITSDSNLLGNFYTTIFTPHIFSLKQLIAKHLIIREDIFSKGAELIDKLKDLSYYSIHIRRNDFEWKEAWIDSQTLFNNIKDIIPLNSKLYISTDHPSNDKFFDIFKKNYQTIFYKDLVQQENFPKNWIPLLEMLICTRGKRFIGTKFSTFSTYIYRLRGYMDDILDNNYYINTEPFNPYIQGPFIKNPEFNDNWTREYPDGWNLNKF